MTFNLFDVAAIAILVFAVVAGIRTGALPQVGGIVGALAALLLLFQLAPWLLDVTDDLDPIVRAFVVLGAVLGGVVIGEGLGSTVGRAIAEGLGTGVLSGLDRFAGALLGGAQAILIIWLAGGLLAASAFPTLGRAAANSTAVRLTDSFLPSPTEVVGDIAGVIDASGLPDVFVGLEPVPLAPVDLPGDPIAAAIARAAAAEHRPRVHEGVRGARQRDRRRRRGRLPRHQRPRRRRVVDDPGRGAGWHRRRDGRPVRPRPRRRAAVRPGPRRARPSGSRRTTRTGARSGRRSATRAAARSSCCPPR